MAIRGAHQSGFLALLLAALLLSACDKATPAEKPGPLAALSGTAGNGASGAASRPSMPVPLADPEPHGLLVAIAQTYPRARQMRTKSETGEVARLGQTAAALDRASADLRAIKRNLARLSQGGPPTFALLHGIGPGLHLQAWLIGPDGAIFTGQSELPYFGLAGLPDGLGITRFALSRGPQRKGEPVQPLDAQDSAEDSRGSPAVVAQRMDTLREASATLLPGPVGAALAAGRGRLLVLPVRDTGTAPYAALPAAGSTDPAARRWSFVVMQDVETLASDVPGFDMGAVDLGKAVVVGDPEDMRDPVFRFPPLPGARKEALAIARLLAVDDRNVLIGEAATRPNVVRAIDRLDGGGIVYMATHAIADARNPLTRGFVVLDRSNLFAGELRATRFRGWDRRHPLVVMSACQTGLGRVFDGGTFGVARTWTDAGAGQVVASLWNVSDHATYQLMTRFARALKAGAAPERAMQLAQLETLREYPDNPKMWASFTIIGKPTLGPTLRPILGPAG
jgi:hypothetical protein